jgi:FkbM family methyltransferase
MKKIIKKIFELFNIGILHNDRLEQLKEFQKDASFILELPKHQLAKLVEIKEKSKAQLKQDFFVLLETNFLQNGFFVEFGATNGLDFSNTYLLEKEYAWNGILVEPARCFYESIKKNRSCYIDQSCVWSASNSYIDFIEDESAPLSTISKFKKIDHHKRVESKTYKIQTISLSDLLKKYNAPKKIDYLSIDTEGSEFEILSNFNFKEYEFKIITCEHNFNKNREKIHNLLSKNGYIRKYTGLSNYDDWYIKIN